MVLPVADDGCCPALARRQLKCIGNQRPDRLTEQKRDPGPSQRAQLDKFRGSVRPDGRDAGRPNGFIAQNRDNLVPVGLVGRETGVDIGAGCQTVGDLGQAAACRSPEDPVRVHPGDRQPGECNPIWPEGCGGQELRPGHGCRRGGSLYDSHCVVQIVQDLGQPVTIQVCHQGAVRETHLAVPNGSIPVGAVASEDVEVGPKADDQVILPIAVGVGRSDPVP